MGVCFILTVKRSYVLFYLIKLAENLLFDSEEVVLVEL